MAYRNLFLALLTLVPFSARAASKEALFESLKDSGEKYSIIGTVCEQAAKLDFQREYPAPSFQIETGISYGNGDRTIGELDVIVFDADQRAVLVAEVKCWKSFSGALKKAADQRKRFRSNLSSGTELQFSDKARHAHRTADFRDLTKFVTVAQSGGAASGFDRELAYSLEDLMDVRARLVACQAQGSCRKSEE
jgi:hypothetical protein